MRTKTIFILVMTLLIITALPSIDTKNIKKDTDIKQLSNSAVVWSDNFDSYDLGQFLDGDPEDGGWRICHCPYVSDGAYVVNTQSLSNPHSVEIVGETDISQDFTGIRSGSWTLSFWVYVPSECEDLSAIAIDSYQPFPWDDLLIFRQLVVRFNGRSGYVEVPWTTDKLPLIKDQWVEFRIEFDLEEDWLECYYNDELLRAKKYTDDIAPGYTGFHNLAAITLAYGGDPMTTPIYHDDFSLEGEATGPVPDLNCEGGINLAKVKPGSKVKGSFTVENIGEPDSRLEWTVEENPEWGDNWEFEPWRGKMTPDDEPITVEVSFTAPEMPRPISGAIKVVAIGDPDDYCEVSITVSPRSKEVKNIFRSFLGNHPNMFPIFRHLLGL